MEIRACWLHGNNNLCSRLNDSDGSVFFGHISRAGAERIVADHGAAARLAEAEQELARAREALAWYAEESNWQRKIAISNGQPVDTLAWAEWDRGDMARAALAPAGGGAEKAGAVGDLTYEEEMAAVRRLQEAQTVEIERPDSEVR